MREALEVGQRLQLKLADSDNEWYSTRLEDISETELAVGTPLKGGAIVPFRAGSVLDCQFPRDDAFYAFQSEVLRRIELPFPMLIIRRPASYQRFQRRRLFRLEMVLPIEYRVAGRQAAQKGTTVDVSGGGLCFVAPERLDTGTELEIQFTLPSGLGVKAHGRVVKVSEVEGANTRHYSHGVEFLGLSPAVQEQIVSAIFAEQRERRRREVRYL